MPQSLALVLVHIIFSTKNREPFLDSPQLRSNLHAYLTGTLRNLECEPLQVGGTEDHVHILSGLSRNTSLADLVKNLKTSSSRNFKNKGPTHFAWQSGYGAFSVSQSSKAA
jgi:REP-associated tyrosine transposase